MVSGMFQLLVTYCKVGKDTEKCELNMSVNCFEKFFALNLFASFESLLAFIVDQSDMAFSTLSAASSGLLYLRFGGTNSFGPPESCTTGRQPEDMASIIDIPNGSSTAECK